jgi:hypothetical protein
MPHPKTVENDYYKGMEEMCKCQTKIPINVEKLSKDVKEPVNRKSHSRVRCQWWWIRMNEEVLSSTCMCFCKPHKENDHGMQ